MNAKKHGKQSYWLICLLLCSLTLCACQREGKGNASKPSAIQFVSEDFVCGNHRTNSNAHPHPIMETERGYYYNERSGRLSLHFYDKENQKDIVLCNKPECKHDGNAFCVATNKKYIPGAFQLYNDRILSVATVFQEGTMEIKLLEISLDGSELTELANLYSIPNKDGDLSIGTNLLIHRNYACIFLGFANPVSFEETVEYGTLFYHLETGESFFANEEPLSRDNPRWQNVTAMGDYIYYAQKPTRRYYKLHRYHLIDRVDEELGLVTNFSGNYALLDENNIFYLRGERNATLYLYHPSDQSNENLGFLTYEFEDERGELRHGQYGTDSLYTDGQYVYAPANLWGGQYDGSSVVIYSSKGEYLKAVPLPNPEDFQIPTLSGETSVLGEADASGFLHLWLLNDKIYYSWNSSIYVTTWEALLLGTPGQDLAYEVLTNLTEANN